MAQHFLLSSAARTLSLAKINRMSDAEAEKLFASIRWARDQGRAGLPALRLLEALSGSPSGRDAPFPLKGLILAHLGDAVRFP